MRIKFIERFKFKYSGRSVPAIKCEDVDIAGKVGTIHLLGTVKKRDNSLISPWDNKGWEIDKEFGQIRVLDEKGTEYFAYVVSEAGITVPLYTRQFAFPNKEDVIGAAATLDDIADSMDMHKSMKYFMIGAIIGVLLGWLIVSPMIGAILK